MDIIQFQIQYFMGLEFTFTTYNLPACYNRRDVSFVCVQLNCLVILVSHSIRLFKTNDAGHDVNMFAVVLYSQNYPNACAKQSKKKNENRLQQQTSEQFHET